MVMKMKSGMFSTLLVFLLFTTASLAAPENLAVEALLSGSGKDFSGATDGVKQQAGKGEWLGGSPNDWWGEIHYPKLELKWNTPRKVNKVRIYDRPSLEEHMAACVLKFSDGSEVHVFAVPNDGAPKTVVFEPRTVTSMKLDVVDGIGTQIGLSEIEVVYDPEAKPDDKRTKHFSDFVSYTLPPDAGEDSFSFLSVLRGTGPSERKESVSTGGGALALRKGSWKYITASPKGDKGIREIQLYDLSADVGESNNLASTRSDQVEKMQALLDQLIVQGHSTPGPRQKHDANSRYPQPQP
jgi:hypothetical protein